MIKKFYIRLCISLFVGGILIGITSLLFRPNYFFLGSAAVLLSAILKFTVLRCPNCGSFKTKIELANNGTIQCPKCNKPIKYKQ